MRRISIFMLLAFSVVAMAVSCKKDQNPDKDPDKITLNLDKTEVTLNIGESVTLNPQVTPADAEVSFSWSSSDDNVAVVDNAGKVTAVSAGNAVITVSADDASASCNVIVKDDTPDPDPSQAPELGDFYYSDGTWSSNLDESKEVIAVVFWAGNPTEHDAMLKKDHPGCTNGLAIAIKSGGACKWQENYDAYGKSVNSWILENASQFNSIEAYIEDPEQTGLMQGYNNTKAIEAFNDSPENAEWPVTVIEKIREFRKTVPAPASSSDWYLPSIKELHLVCAKECNDIYLTKDVTGRNFLNERLGMISGADKLPVSVDNGAGFVKSSTEGMWWPEYQQPSRAFNVVFEDGAIGESSKTFAPSIYRAVLAF